MKDLLTLEKEFNSLCEEIIRKIEIIKDLPSNELKQRKLVWTGIVGAIQSSIDAKRAQKILGTVICEDKTYLDMFNYLLDATDRFVEIQKQVQKQLTPNDIPYFSYIDAFYFAIKTLHSTLCRYSQTVSMSYDGDITESLYSKTLLMIGDKLKQLELRPSDSKESRSDSNSGCLGVMLLFIVSALTVMGGIGYALSQIIA